jgi:hypothetical protein
MMVILSSHAPTHPPSNHHHHHSLSQHFIYRGRHSGYLSALPDAHKRYIHNKLFEQNGSLTVLALMEFTLDRGHSRAIICRTTEPSRKKLLADKADAPKLPVVGTPHGDQRPNTAKRSNRKIDSLSCSSSGTSFPFGIPTGTNKILSSLRTQ